MKKIAASLLVFLFVQIHVVKVFHSHNTATKSASHNHSISTFANNQYCAICDYHLGKDADHHEISFDLVQPHPIKPVHAILHESSLSIFYSHSAVRGPPSC